MTEASQVQMVAHFLGAGAARGGPFRLLDLPTNGLSNEVIISALDRQLQRVDDHPDAGSPEAEEVRLILQANASQLMDPALRRALVSIWTTGAGVHPRQSQPLMGRDKATIESQLEHDATVAMARYGGWNQQALRRIASLAHARGVSNQQLARTLREMAGRRAALLSSADAIRSADPQSEHDDREPVAEELERDATRRRTWGAVTVIGIFVLSVVGNAWLASIVIDRFFRRPPATVTIASAGADPSPDAKLPPPTVEGPPETPPAPLDPEPDDGPELLTDGREILSELEACVRSIDRSSHDAGVRFAFAVRSLQAVWPELPDSQRRAANHRVVEFLFASAEWSEVARSAVEVIVEPIRALSPQRDGGRIDADDVWPCVWAAGMMNRLAGQRDLPGTVSSQIRTELAAAGASLDRTTVASFDGGARLALLRLPSLLIDEAASGPGGSLADVRVAVERWCAAVRSLLADDRAGRQRLLMDGAEIIMADLPEPSDHQGVLEAIRTIISVIDWRPGGVARARTLEWFRNRRLSNDDLAEVTGTIAAVSTGDGIDASMVLSRSASREDRLELRGRYAGAWGLEQAATADETTTRWAELSRELLINTAASDDDFDSFVRLAFLNEIARRIWRGDNTDLDPVFDAIGPGEIGSPMLNLATVRATPPSQRVGDADGRWAVRYRAARRNTPVREDLLDDLEGTGGHIGPIDAEILVEEAFMGSPVDAIRKRAQELVVFFAHDPDVINGILEVIPRRRTVSRAIATMVEDVVGTPLGDRKDPKWHFEARRALVERLLLLLAASDPTTKPLDDLAIAAASSYQRRSGLGDGSISAAGDPSVAAAGMIIDAAREVAAQLTMDVDAVGPVDRAPVSLEQIERLRQGRLELAVGPVQIFAAEQIYIAELTAYVIAAEQRSRAGEVERIVDELTTERRSARSIVRQIKEAERAVLRLWLIRYGEAFQ